MERDSVNRRSSGLATGTTTTCAIIASSRKSGTVFWHLHGRYLSHAGLTGDGPAFSLCTRSLPLFLSFIPYGVCALGNFALRGAPHSETVFLSAFAIREGMEGFHGP